MTNYTATETEIRADGTHYHAVTNEDDFKRFNWTPLLLMIVLIGIGIWNLMSATSTEDKASGLYRLQLMWVGCGLGLTGFLLLIHYSFLSRLAYFIYFANTLLLVATLLVGSSALGAKRWIGIGPFRIQPSEFMKLSLILCLAKYF